ncbi:MAG: hypothetical protein GX542_13720 [Rhodococcus sp.]|nr:hypothetical protein [Rhodococcus sp. (in: high G+C Gram-positive bacteria)]
MSILETSLIFVVIPLAIVLLLGLSALFGKAKAVPTPEAFRLGEKWEHSPILWSAVDVVTTNDHHHAHHDVNDSAALIGGTAHGKW